MPNLLHFYTTDSYYILYTFSALRLGLSLVTFSPNVNNIGYCTILYFSTSSDDKLHYRHKGNLRLVLFSKDEVAQVLRECHDNPGTGGHPGVRRTTEKVMKSYHWQTLWSDVKKWVRNFDGVCYASGKVSLFIVVYIQYAP